MGLKLANGAYASAEIKYTFLAAPENVDRAV